MRCTTITLVIMVALVVTGCSEMVEDGYRSPPGYGESGLQSATERAHQKLLGATYLLVTRDQDCREACDVFLQRV